MKEPGAKASSRADFNRQGKDASTSRK